MRKQKEYQNLSEWHEWYAWYPVEVRVSDGKYVKIWLERVQRRIVGCYEGDVRYYRNLDGTPFEWT